MTTIKSFCQDAEAAAYFSLHIIKLVQEKIDRQDCPKHLAPKVWKYYQTLATKAVIQIENYLKKPTIIKATALQELLSEIKQTQNEYQYQKWGPVRIIQSSDVLLVEKALYCVLSPAMSEYWGYQVAKEYAEQYNPKFGTGLLPESAPMVEEIADFWCRNHTGKTLDEWLSSL